MRTIRLGETTVFPVVLGTTSFGTRLTQAESFDLMDAFAAAGGNMIDTANAYGFTPESRSRSEKTVAAWLGQTGAPMLLATKGAHHRDDYDGSRVRPKLIAQDVLESSDIFGREIDLYWLHRDDPTYPVEPLMDALFAQQNVGRIAAIGASNWSPERIAAANAYAASCGRAGFTASQVQYALCMPATKEDPSLVWLDERVDGPFFAREEMPVYAYSSQSHGYVAKALAGGDLRGAAIYDTPENRRKAQECERIAREVGASPNAVALVYLLYQEFPCAAVTGPKSIRQLHDTVAAAHVRLTPAQINALRSA